MNLNQHLMWLRTSQGDLRYLRAGVGRPIVLIHTLRTQLEYFLPLVEAIDCNCFEVIVPDLPGHGASVVPVVDYTADFFVETIEEFLQILKLRDVIVVGESIGAVIGLLLAARGNASIAKVVALNPYDYGIRGGIRRSSRLANALFTAMLWPAIGWVVARAGTQAILRRVIQGGFHDAAALSTEFVAQLTAAGRAPGHARAFRSLCVHWQTWVDARAAYANVTVPVTLAYGTDDWSEPVERDANGRTLGVTCITMPACGHFSALERPLEIARIVQAAG